MKSPTKIIINVEKRFVDEIEFNGEMIYFDPSFNPEHNVIPSGTVVGIPMRDPQILHMSPEFFFNVQVGDKLYFNYNVIMDETNLIVNDGKEYWLVDYYQALAIVRDGKILPVGEHILIEPQEVEVSSDTIIIPDTAKTKVSGYGRVFASLDSAIPNGSIVAFEEQGMFENIIEGKKLFVMYYSNILALKN